MKRFFSLLFVAASAASMSAATDLVVWNFNNSTAGSGGAPGTFNTTGTVEIFDTTTEKITVASHGVYASTASVNLSDLAGSMGGASANNNWGSFGGNVLNAFSGDTAGGALAVIGSGQTGHFVDFKFSTQGYNNLVVSYITQRTSTGPNSQAWSVSSDGLTYNPVTTVSTIPTAFGLQTFGLEDGYSDLAEIFLRVTFSGATSTSGNNRIDNFRILGDAMAVPEPAMYAALMGACAAAFAAMQRRRVNA